MCQATLVTHTQINFAFYQSLNIANRIPKNNIFHIFFSIFRIFFSQFIIYLVMKITAADVKFYRKNQEKHLPYSKHHKKNWKLYVEVDGWGKTNVVSKFIRFSENVCKSTHDDKEEVLIGIIIRMFLRWCDEIESK